jgi:tetratricopeptide (TPR) repeat protein
MGATVPAYRVDKTPGGGYWVTETDAAGLIVGAVGAVAGAAIGAALGAASGQVDFRKAEQAMAAIRSAADSEDWSLAYELAQKYVRHYPTFKAGYEALADAAMNLEGLPVPERLEVAKLAETHGVNRGLVLALRAMVYFDAKAMPDLLREANSLVTCEGEYKAVGHCWRAQALLWLGDLDQALADANVAASLMPSAGCYMIRADVSWATGDLAKAAADYSMAVRLEPNEPKPLRKRASVHEALGHIEAAEEDRRAALQLAAVVAGPSMHRVNRVHDPISVVDAVVRQYLSADGWKLLDSGPGLFVAGWYPNGIDEDYTVVVRTRTLGAGGSIETEVDATSWVTQGLADRVLVRLCGRYGANRLFQSAASKLIDKDLKSILDSLDRELPRLIGLASGHAH